MSTIIGALRVNISLDSAAFERGVGRAKTGLRGLRVGLAGVAAMAGAGLGLGQAVQTLRGFESSMARVKAISGATEQEFGRMRDVAREMGETTEFSASAAAGGLAFLAQAGFSAQDATDALPRTLELATAGALGLAEAADIASNVMSGFSLPVAEVGRVSDVLAKSASISNTNVQQLGDAMRSAAPVANMLDISIEETAAAIGVLSDAGIQGSQSGVGLAGVMNRMIKPTKDVERGLASAGLTLADVDIEALGLTGVLERLHDAELTAGEAAQIFGAEHAKSGAVLIEGIGKLRDYTGSLNAAEGAAGDMARTMRDQLDGDFKSLSSAVEGLTLSLGEGGLTEVIRQAVQTATGFVRALSGWDLLDEVAMSAAALAAGLGALVFPIAAIGAVSAGAIAYIVGNWGSLQDRFPRVTGAISGGIGLMRGAFDTIGSVAAGAAASLTAGLAGFREGVDGFVGPIRDKLQGAADDLGPILDNLSAAFGVIMGVFAGEDGDAATTGMREIGTVLGAIAGLALEGVANSLGLLTEGIKAVTGVVAGVLQSDFGAAWASLRGFFDYITGEIQLAPWITGGIDFGPVTASVLGLVVDAGAELANWVASLPAVGAELVAGLADGIAAEVGEVLDAIAGIWTQLRGAVVGWKDDLRDIGRDAISGLTLGILGGKSEVEGAAAEVARSAGSSIRRATRTRSPSREWMEIGRDLSDGLGIGIEDGQGRVEDAARSLAEGVSDTMRNGLADLPRKLGDAIAGGLANGGLSGAFADLASLAKSSLTSIVSGGITSLFTGGAASASVGGGGTGGGGGILGNLLGGAGLLGQGGILSNIGGAISGAWTGLSGVLTGGGLGSSFANLGGLVTGKVGGAGAIGAALPAAGIIAAGVAAIVSGFKKEYDGRFLRGSLSGEGFDGHSADFWDGGWIRGDKEVRVPIEAETQAMLDGTAKAIRDNVRDMAANLGLASDATADFATDQFTVWISGPNAKSGEEVAAKLQAQLDGLAVGMSDLVLTTNEYSHVGETSYDTLTRLGGAIQSANEILETLGHRMFTLSLHGADMASGLVDAFGGIDAMNAASTAYFSAFYTEAEQFDIALGRVRAAFGDLGQTMPETRAQFRAMIEAQDLTTAAGRMLYAELIGLSGALAEVLPGVMDLSAEVGALLGNAATGIDGLLSTANSAMRANQTAATTWYRAADTLRGLIAELRGTSGALVSGAQARAYNEARFQTALSRAIAGDNGAAGDLTGAARALLDSAAATASSRVDLARIEARVLSDLNLAAGVSDVEGARHDVIAGLHGDQISLLGEVKDYLTGGGALDPAQIDALSGQIGALEAALQSAEMINYAFLKERLSVSVDLIADANVPPYLRRMLADAARGVTSSIDYIVRAPGLTPDLRWIALTGASEHIKTVDFLVGAKLPADTNRLALASVSDLRKTVNLVVGTKLPRDTMRLALTGSSELSRTVNAVLSSQADTRAIHLAFSNIGAYDVAVRAALHRSTNDDVRKIVFGEVGTYAAAVTAALAADIAPWARAVLLGRQGQMIVNITGVLSSGLSQAHRRLLLEANTAALRGVTVAMAFARSVSAAERGLLLDAGVTTLRRIEAIVNPAGWTPDGVLFLRALSDAGVVTRRMDGRLDLVRPSIDAALLLRLTDSSVVKRMRGGAWMGQGMISADGISLLRMADSSVVKRMYGGAWMDKAKISADGMALLRMGHQSVVKRMHGGAWLDKGKISTDGVNLLRMTDGRIVKRMLGGAWLDSAKVSADGVNLLRMTDASVVKRMRGGAWLEQGKVSADGISLLRMNSDSIKRILKGSVVLSNMTPQQSALLAAVHGSSNGRLTLGGSFSFDPSASFRTWYDATTRSAISSPIWNLRQSLGQLAETIRDEGAGREAQLAADRLRQEAATRSSALTDYADGLARNRSGQHYATDAQIRHMAQIAGVSTAGHGNAVAARVAEFSDADDLASIVMDNGGHRLNAYLRSLVGANMVDIRPDAYLAAYSDVKSSPEFHFQRHGRGEIASGQRQLARSAFDWASMGVKIPGYATGINFAPGGVAMVGERGPELVELPRGARVNTALQTRAMMGGGNEALIREVRELRREISELRAQERQFGLRNSENLQKLGRMADRERRIGIAVTNPGDGTKLQTEGA
ncbi:phage tail tape measure protein [Jannaschia sp. M317]|uniref:phage tail tape measure protein n=1 Tax=Jannaschia sp. M317 TaxID=2867011 RepID=UPI0021A7BA93|nr:phage tail tape measure protein [Jannaschia sp. M317]UWQ16158.1 phage tail tape measure protein [Jannaschia sp. M317]